MTAVVVSGIAGNLPLAGVALHYLQYCLGLRDLGVEVSYLEDNQGWPLLPETNEPDEDATYTVAWLRRLFEAFDLPWAYQAPDGTFHGATEAEVDARLAAADLFLNVSGGATLGDRHRLAGATVYVDTDPAFTQVAMRQHVGVHDWIASHDLHFTFAERMGTPGCRLPDTGVEWRTTRQPVWLPFWAETPDVPGDRFTTVMNWAAYGVAEWEGEDWGQKGVEFPKIQGVPAATGIPCEVAVAGDDAPRAELAAGGWTVTDPRGPTADVWTFRDYIAGSLGELTIVKQGYARSVSGWFSERSANYLAAGRPVVAQDTGWAGHLLPIGRGLLAFDDEAGALDAARAVAADPEGHARAARALAAEHFDATTVLTRFLSDAGVD